MPWRCCASASLSCCSAGRAHTVQILELRPSLGSNFSGVEGCTGGSCKRRPSADAKSARPLGFVTMIHRKMRHDWTQSRIDGQTPLTSPEQHRLGDGPTPGPATSTELARPLRTRTHWVTGPEGSGDDMQNEPVRRGAVSWWSTLCGLQHTNC